MPESPHTESPPASEQTKHDESAFHDLLARAADLTAEEFFQAVRADLRARWERGEPILVETYALRLPGLAANPGALVTLIREEVALRQQRGERPTLEEYLARFPQFEPQLRGEFQPTLGLSATPPAERTWQPTEVDGIRPPRDPAGPMERPVVPGYDVLEEIGRGGMGVVYRARQISLKRVVALKMILAGPHAGPDQIARFRSEAEAVAALLHPNIVHIYEIGEHGGRPFIALEYVNGGSLEAHLAGQPVPGRVAAHLLETLARAVHHAHERGIVHRDLKPANILLQKDEGGRMKDESDPSGSSFILHPSSFQPKITDFGLAKHLGDADGTPGPGCQTRTGAILGTPSYMAPEQAEGRSREVGPLTDVYALGAILYELLTGRPPFRGASLLETLEQVRVQDPEPPSRFQTKIHRDLETICLKTLAKDPARRYASAQDLAEDLARYDAGEPILARRESLASRLWRKARRSPTVLTLVLVLIGAAAAIGYFAHQADRARRVNALREAFETEAESRDWTASHRQRLEEVLADLDGLAPDQAAVARRTLHQRFADAVRARLREPRSLTPEVLAGFRDDLDWLEARAPELVPELREGLAKRLRVWDPLFDLAAPFDRSSAVLDPILVRVDQADSIGPTLVRHGPPEPIVLTRVACRGSNVQLTAVFADGSWQSAPSVGLLLNASQLVSGRREPGKPEPAGRKEQRRSVRGYAFVLRVPPPSGKAAHPATLGDALRQDGRLTLQIHRNGALLRERAVQIPAGPLQITAVREGDRLTVQVNALPPLEFFDPFPLHGPDPGAFALDWPEGVRLTRLRAAQQPLPAEPSELERGDDLYARGEFARAQAHYTNQARDSAGTPAGQEARCKEALCLVGLQREDEAAELFREVQTETGTRWPAVAACQLWLLHLRHKRLDEADQVLAQLSGLYRFEELAAVIPEDVRGRILDAYRPHGVYDFLRHNPNRVRNLLRADMAEELFNAPAAERWRTRSLLLSAYHAEGNLGGAIRTAERLLADSSLSAEARTDVVNHYAWLLIESQSPERALAEVDRWLFDEGGHQRPDYLLLGLARARVHVALKQWREAELDAEELFRRMPVAKTHYFYEACLVRGFLRRQRGDEAGAQQAWLEGYHKAQGTRDMSELHAAILASLTGRLTEEDVQKMVDGVLDQISGSFPAASVVRGRLFPFSELTPALRDMWRSRRGQEYARKVAFDQVSYTDYFSVQVKLSLWEVIRIQAFPRGMSPAEDELAWKMVSDGYTLYAAGKMTDGNLLQLTLAWAGTSNELGWKGLAAAMEPYPDFRGPLAYLTGQRFRQLRQPAEARKCYHMAIQDARTDELRGLSQKALAELGPRSSG
jgi:serine/threonine protein kinase